MCGDWDANNAQSPADKRADAPGDKINLRFNVLSHVGLTDKMKCDVKIFFVSNRGLWNLKKINLRQTLLSIRRCQKDPSIVFYCALYLRH